LVNNDAAFFIVFLPEKKIQFFFISGLMMYIFNGERGFYKNDKVLNQAVSQTSLDENLELIFP
jgi:hypothetical protein